MKMMGYRLSACGLTSSLLFLFAAGAAVAQNVPARKNVIEMTTEERLKRIESISAPKPLPKFFVDPVASRVPTGFVAPAGAASSSEYVAAYRTSSNCVFWYEMPTSDSMIHAQWKGSACKGQPLSGEGNLRITAAKTVDGKKLLVQHEFAGNFTNGFLTGAGLKSNVLFNTDRTPTGEAYFFDGNFAWSSLSGRGTRFGLFPAGSPPSVIAYSGNFVDGQPHGLIERLSIGHGEGVKGDIFFLDFEKGAPLIDQSRRGAEVVGYIHTLKGEWKVALNEWRNGRPRGAQLSWAGDEGKPGTAAYCSQWQVEGPLWKCPSGNFALREQGGAAELGAEATAFSVSAIADRPLRLVAPGRVQVRDDKSVDFNHSLSCDVELAACTGTAIVELGILDVRYWSGEVEYRAGALKPVGKGRFMALAADTPQAFINAKRTLGDRVEMDCARLASPTDCADGLIRFDDGVTYRGAHRLEGTAYGTKESSRLPPSYYKAGNTSDWIPYGSGRIDFGNGLVAQVQIRDEAIVSVSDCSWPEHGAGSCTVDDGKVIFRARREARETRVARPTRRESSSSSKSYSDYPSAPQRYEPIAVPQRPTYVLPGMR